MSKRSEKLLIEDIIESIERILDYTKNLNYAAQHAVFVQNVLRLLGFSENNYFIKL